MRRMIRRNIVGPALLAAALGLLAGCSTPPAELEHITISYPTRTGQVWPLYIAKEGGYYEKYGLDVDLVFGIHPAGIAMIVSGQAAMTPYTLEQSMEAAMQDASLTAVGSPYKKSLFALMANHDISDMSQLRGKRIGVSQLADAPYNYTIALLSTVGLTARDVEWVPVGTGVATRAAALISGRIDATMLTAPNYFSVEQEGYSNLANISDYDDIYAPSVYLFTKATLEEHPDLAERLIKAHAEAIKRYYDDKAFAVQAYLAWDPEQKQEEVEEVYDHYRMTNTYERVPYVLDAAVQYILNHPPDEQIGARMAEFDFSQVIDNSIVDRLVQEGFFEELYGPEIAAEQERKAGLAFR